MAARRTTASGANYNLAVELQDVLDLLTLLNLEKVIVIGTSRGGLLAMLMGAARPGALAAVVLNDIGPVIEPQGLLRIRQHMRERQVPGSWEEAGDNLRRMWETFYPRLGDDQWQTLARKLYREKDGRILPDYDANLVKPMEDMNLDGPPPAMWAQFMSLSHVPVMALRGENSDILSAATLSAMNECHRAMTTLEIADAGHAPLLIDPEEIRPVAAFVNACDQSAEP